MEINDDLYGNLRAALNRATEQPDAIDSEQAAHLLRGLEAAARAGRLRGHGLTGLRRLTSTHTYVIMELSPAAYAEIRHKMEEANYQHAFGKDSDYVEPVIDMHGIAVAVQGEPKPTPHADADERTKTRAGKPL